jgi:hypothetical protein
MLKTKTFLILIISFLFISLTKPDKTFMIFQFPQHQIPRIDGDFLDWKMVPDAYVVGLDELKNTVFGEGEDQNPQDFDLKVKVGWVKGLNRLYFYIEAYDDFWDFEDDQLGQDIFELVVDGDASGGSFINQKNWDFNKRLEDQPFFEGSGTHAQNYHIFTPAFQKDWAMAWGNKPWIKEFPYANVAYQYDFKQGESGILKMEFYVTAYDFASHDRPENSIESTFKENKNIGISWSMLDFDGEKCESFMNLSHDIRMIRNASYLRTFKLMPVEDASKKPITANWKFSVDQIEKKRIHFYDHSTGEITKWHWDFGDGTTSDEKNPIHQYSKKNVWTVKLTVEGPTAKSQRSKVWEVLTE